MSQYPFLSAAYCMSRDYTVPNMCVGIEPQFTSTKRLVIECGRTSKPSYCRAPVCDSSTLIVFHRRRLNKSAWCTHAWRVLLMVGSYFTKRLFRQCFVRYAFPCQVNIALIMGCDPSFHNLNYILLLLMSSNKHMVLYNVTFSCLYLCLRQCEIYLKKVIGVLVTINGLFLCLM